MNTNSDRWERFLDPEVVRPSLFLATMFITTFEILKDSVVDRVRDFYSNGWDGDGPIVGPDYQRDVASKNKSALYASLDWLREHEAIDDADLQTFEHLKKIRNLLAHQLFSVVTGQAESDHSAKFPVLVALLRKIEVWWVVNVEIPTNPDFAGQEIDEAGIVPGAVLSLQMLIEVASGNTELLEHWRKARTHGRTDA
jgi:hypothetical protein